MTAGNTAPCTVVKTGNDQHYRGYDILDVSGNQKLLDAMPVNEYDDLYVI